MKTKITVKSKEQLIKETNVLYVNETFKMIPMLNEYTNKTVDAYVLSNGDAFVLGGGEVSLSECGHITINNKGPMLTKDEYTLCK